MSIRVRVPASTANLGPGFDCLGMALSITAEIGVIDDATGTDEVAKAVDEHHPASAAFRRTGGLGTLWVRSPIPMGRGLGYSGAMRVGGAAVGIAQAVGGDAGSFSARLGEVLAVAADLERHADNAAASLIGGIVATDGERAINVDTPLRPDVVVWIPPSTTSTNASRTSLPQSVSFRDATFNVGRTALLVAALVAGDVAALALATQDRLHQEIRFAQAESSRAALAAGIAAGAWCGWLSGSGPTIALLTAAGDGARIATALPADGRTNVVGIDWKGVVLTG